MAPATVFLADDTVVRVGRTGPPGEARAWVRELVGELGHEWHGFEPAARGAKPRLRRSPVDANVSHSREVTAVVATTTGRVGIDVQHPESVFDQPGLLRMMCTPEERARIALTDAARRRTVLSRAWTIKEAYAKALGVGLALGFAGVDADDIRRPIPGRRVWTGVLADGAALAVALLTEPSRT